MITKQLAAAAMYHDRNTAQNHGRKHRRRKWQSKTSGMTKMHRQVSETDVGRREPWPRSWLASRNVESAHEIRQPRAQTRIRTIRCLTQLKDVQNPGCCCAELL